PRCLLSDLAERHIVVVVRDLPDQAPVAELVRHHEHEMDVMPAPGKLADRRGVVSQRPGVTHREQDFHQSLSIEAASSRLKNHTPEIIVMAISTSDVTRPGTVMCA